MSLVKGLHSARITGSLLASRKKGSNLIDRTLLPGRPPRKRTRLINAPLLSAPLICLIVNGNCFAAQDYGEAREPNDLAESRGPSANLAPDSQAVRETVSNLASGGAALKALTIAREQRDIFTEVDLARIEELAVRQQVRGGRDKSRAMTAPDRFDGLKAALRSADEFDARLPRTDEYADVRFALAGDKTVALASSGRMQDAVAVFETIPTNAAVSVDALAAAGDAYAYLNEPKKATSAYLRALEVAAAPSSSTNAATSGFQYGVKTRTIDLREALFWSYLDQGDYVLAGQTLDAMEGALPPADQIRPWQVANDDYLRVYRLRAQFQIYIGHTREGVAQLTQLEQQVPFNSEIRSALADITLSQGQPRQATAMYAAAQTDHPDSVETLAGFGRASMTTQDYRTANEINQTFGDAFPENAAVKSFQRDFKTFQSPVLTTELSGEHGNTALASDAFSVDAYLYSPPIATDWRVFSHTFYGQATTDTGNVKRTRTGLGADFRMNSWIVLGEATQSFGPDGRTGGNGAISYSVNDQIKLSGQLDSDANSLPWKAYVAHIFGRTAGLTFSFDDQGQRQFNGSYTVGRYSDENFHQEFSIYGLQRVYTTAKQQINLSLGAGTSSNTRENAPYFNPSRDYSVELTASHQWNIWKQGDKSLQQQFLVSGGAYNQRGFGTSGFWGARIEHTWSFKNDITLIYGIGVNRHAYDGVQEFSETGYLALNIPF